ncbi:tetraacyldisaccharide 4'-kinase [Vicingaceae bacterium]|nr:tetraacyldisaccharide 4'-kinase [Vicingaceae bacterium]
MLSYLYGIVLFIRNIFFDIKVFKETSFNIPIISVGNLSLGGTGKTPHIEYLIKLLKNEFKIATLSRGYKRKTKGFILSNNNSTIKEIGDEPLQFKLKFKDIKVAVDEKRVNGVKQIIKTHPTTNVILLDDAYQHRAIGRGINILITEYNNLYTSNYVIPSGTLREFSLGSKRANVIIVSKCPSKISEEEKDNVIQELSPENYQSVFFTYIKYGQLLPFSNIAEKNKIINKLETNVVLITGIAKPEPLIKQLTQEFKSTKHIKFPDHHSFDSKDLENIKTQYKNLEYNNKIIITTEKDIMRLSLPSIIEKIQDIPIYYIPIEICFHGNGKKEFANIYF